MGRLLNVLFDRGRILFNNMVGRRLVASVQKIALVGEGLRKGGGPGQPKHTGRCD